MQDPNNSVKAAQFVYIYQQYWRLQLQEAFAPACLRQDKFCAIVVAHALAKLCVGDTHA